MLRKAIRTVQNYFPALEETKNEFYHQTRKHLGFVHEPDFAVLKHLPVQENDLFLDVGANRGQSILAMRRFRPGARIISFEPNPLMFRWLEEHFEDDANLTVMNFGLAATAQERTLYVPSYRGFVYDGVATFSREKAFEYLSPETLYRFDRDLLTVDQMVCRTRPLDSLSLAPTFVKIDVEGCEHEVISGGMQTLRRHKPVLMIERFYDNPRLMDLLEELRYMPVVEIDGRFVEGQSDLLNQVWMVRDALSRSS
jgi:FkbM family methyltransferase